MHETVCKHGHEGVELITLVEGLVIQSPLVDRLLSWHYLKNRYKIKTYLDAGRLIPYSYLHLSLSQQYRWIT
jgi:hypothetical protein